MRRPSPQPNVAAATVGPGFSLYFWLLVIAVGVGAGLAGGGLMLLLHAVEHLAWPYAPGNDNLLDAIRRAGLGRRILTLVIAGVWVSFGGLLIRRLFGSGGDVNASIWFRSGRVVTVATFARAVLSIVAVGLGTSLGREAAVKQSGGAMASKVAEWARLPPAHRRLLVAWGVGAGMGAAYNVPLGGALFGLEVMLGTLSFRLVLPAVAMSVVAVATSWLFLPTGAIYTLHDHPLTVSVTLWSLVAGPVLGCVAAGLVRAIAWAGAIRLRGAAAVLGPIVALSLLGVASVAVPELLGNGKESVQLALDGQIGLGLLLVLPAAKIVATAGCLAGGARGGLFTPTMMVGAVAGGLLGRAWGTFWPGADLGLCALIGSGAVLAAATAGPVSAIVLILELTRHADPTMVPMLLAVVGATVTAARLEYRSLYSARAPAAATDLPPRPPASPGWTWFDAPAVASAATQYSDLVQQLLVLPKESAVVYVLDDEGRLVGAVDPADVDPSRFRPLPPDDVAAADVARPVAALTWPVTVTVDAPTPVVDATTGRFLGVACPAA